MARAARLGDPNNSREAFRLEMANNSNIFVAVTITYTKNAVGVVCANEYTGVIEFAERSNVQRS